jgi:Trehalase-like, N-terminal/Glycosyl hydrolases family 15
MATAGSGRSPEICSPILPIAERCTQPRAPPESSSRSDWARIIDRTSPAGTAAFILPPDRRADSTEPLRDAAVVDAVSFSPATGLMSSRIEDYAVIGNCETLGLVGRDGSMDWLCLPRFDSPACFAALLGEPKNGRWLIGPASDEVQATRRYCGDTLILETVFRTASGSASLTDFMARRKGACDIVRIVRGLQGAVSMRMELIARFDYGSVVPWVSRQEDGRLRFVAGPHRLLLDTNVKTRGEDLRTVAELTVSAGQEASFVLNWSPSYTPAPAPLKAADALKHVKDFWSDWVRSYSRSDDHADTALRSLLTLKALAHWTTGGIVAAGTTSLPEKLGGSRNWDYRYCWLRDATFTLLALTSAGFLDEARAWREWLLRAVAGSPDDVRRGGRAPPRRIRDFLAFGLSGRKARARGQRRVQTAATRRLWRSARCVLRQPQVRTRAERRQLGARAGASRPSRDHLAPARRRRLGGSRRRQAIHPFESDGLGRLRPWRSFDRGIQA